MRIAVEIVNSGARRSNTVDQVGHMATSTQKWVTPIVLYLGTPICGFAQPGTDLSEELLKKRGRTEVFALPIGSHGAHRQARFQLSTLVRVLFLCASGPGALAIGAIAARSKRNAACRFSSATTMSTKPSRC
jgi:hypothetical protein